MRRRKFIALLGSMAVAWPLAARAQSASLRRVGVLMNGAATDAVVQSYLAAFKQGLRELGWTEGKNIRVDVRWSAADPALARIYAAQLIGLMPDVILASTTLNLTVVQQATSTVPVVFVQVSDPVVQGFVPNVTRPAGNLTGFSIYEFSIGGKWLDLLKAIAPSLARVAVMFNPETALQSKFFMRSIESAAPSLGVEATAMPVRATGDIEPAIESFARLGNAGVILPPDSFTNMRQSLIVDLANRHRLPAISAIPEFAKEGALMSYSAAVNVTDQFRQAAHYADRILKGEKPGDLPVQAPSKYQFVINLRPPGRSASPCRSRCWA
jgi:putative ABC transport system substrate-binding protein